jgi:DNA invertase Pin-like site-specific DNA recombinase
VTTEKGTAAGSGGERRREAKIGDRHLERLAVVYVRHATVEPTAKQEESLRRQYRLAERAMEFGWRRESVRVIDEDIGRPGMTAEGRRGFQRLLVEVGLDPVGMILAVEMSRFSRSYRDWHHLLQECARSRTLIADTEGIYDPSDAADRMLLELGGVVWGAELEMACARLVGGGPTRGRVGDAGTMEVRTDGAPGEGDGGVEE